MILHLFTNSIVSIVFLLKIEHLQWWTRLFTLFLIFPFPGPYQKTDSVVKFFSRFLLRRELSKLRQINKKDSIFFNKYISFEKLWTLETMIIEVFLLTLQAKPKFEFRSKSLQKLANNLEDDLVKLSKTRPTYITKNLKTKSTYDINLRNETEKILWEKHASAIACQMLLPQIASSWKPTEKVISSDKFYQQSQRMQNQPS